MVSILTDRDRAPDGRSVEVLHIWWSYPHLAKKGFAMSSLRIANSRLTSDHQKGRSDSTKARARGPSKPACDLHINLQMEATTFMTPTGRILGHVCPVPSCGRRYDGISYFQEPEVTGATNEGIPSDPCVSFGAF